MTLRPAHYCVLACLAFSLASVANATTVNTVLDFEGFTAGQIIDDEYATSPPPGSNVSAVNLSFGPNVAIIFDTDSPTGGDLDLAAPFTSDNPNFPDNYYPGNVLIIQETQNCNFNTGFCDIPDDEGSSPAGEIEFVFDNPITLLSIDFFDIEFNENANDPNSQIRLFDESNVEIMAGVFFVPNTGGNNKWDQVNFGSVSGVKRLVIELNGSGAIDNVTYVPVPPAVWLFGSALGLLGWIRRKAA